MTVKFISLTEFIVRLKDASVRGTTEFNALYCHALFNARYKTHVCPLPKGQLARTFCELLFCSSSNAHIGFSELPSGRVDSGIFLAVCGRPAAVEKTRLELRVFWGRAHTESTTHTAWTRRCSWGRAHTESTRHESTRMSHETNRLGVRGNMDTPMRERRICD